MPRTFYLAFQSKGRNCIHRGTLTLAAEDWGEAVVKAANFAGPLDLEVTALEDESASDRLDSRMLLAEAAIEAQEHRLDALYKEVNSSAALRVS